MSWPSPQRLPTRFSQKHLPGRQMAGSSHLVPLDGEKVPDFWLIPCFRHLLCSALCLHGISRLTRNKYWSVSPAKTTAAEEMPAWWCSAGAGHAIVPGVGCGCVVYLGYVFM